MRLVQALQAGWFLAVCEDTNQMMMQYRVPGERNSFITYAPKEGDWLGELLDKAKVPAVENLRPFNPNKMVFE